MKSSSFMVKLQPFLIDAAKEITRLQYIINDTSVEAKIQKDLDELKRELEQEQS